MTADVYGTLDTALAHARRLLATDPSKAEAQAREILNAVPGQSEAVLLLGTALLRRGLLREALAVLAPLTDAPQASAQVYYMLGLVLAGLGRDDEALTAFTSTTTRDPSHPDAWRALGDQRALAGDVAGSHEAHARHIQASVHNPELLEAGGALCANQLGVAEWLLRAFLKRHPTDVAAIRMLAEVAARIERYEDAENLLARAVELAPDFLSARHNYATILHRRDKPQEALAQIDLLLADDPQSPVYRNLMAAVLARLGETTRAIEAYEQVLERQPHHPKVWMSFGHALKAAGRRADSVKAYRRSIQCQPSLGEAYWSLANLKTFRFADDDVAAMHGQLARADITDEDRFHLHFSLGKALEDGRDYAKSFQHYAEANALRRIGLKYSADEITTLCGRIRDLFTPAFLHAHAGVGATAPDPIFVVGLPRAGSTLIEQILASHSEIEGTMELPDVMAIVRRLGGHKRHVEDSEYPQVLASLDADAFRDLGEEYLTRTRIHRKLGRPFFIDKMPNNFLHAGFIHLMLPNARIIDARRHPLASGFSCFKQHFARGQAFTYDLTDMGRYYADYVALMEHFDTVLPGRVHRVHYEEMVADPEREVRRLLDYCGLPFEEGCLRFYENDRVVRTASSEQVRSPIFTEGLDQWRHYEPWLAPLKTALGSVLMRCPQ